METLEKRLERLERESRRLRWLCAFLILSVGFLMTALARQYLGLSTLAAKEFQVVGTNGNLKVQLGESGLRIGDVTGKRFVVLDIADELAELRFVGFKSGGIGFYGSDGKTGGSLRILEKRADLVLRGEAGSVVLSSGQLPSQEYLGFRSFVSLSDQNGKVVWNAP